MTRNRWPPIYEPRISNGERLLDIVFEILHASKSVEDVLLWTNKAEQIIQDIADEEARRIERPFIYGGITSAPG